MDRDRSTSIRPDITSNNVPEIKSLFPYFFSAKWGDVSAFKQCSTSSTTFTDSKITSGERSRRDTFNINGLCFMLLISVI